MHKKNIIKSVVCFTIFLFCFSLAQASIDKDLCEFNGFITGPDQWEEVEFSNLLKSEEMPGYHLMMAIIGKISLADNNTLKSSSCNISKYVAKLMEFYNKNKIAIKQKHEETADLLDYIERSLKK